MNTQRCDLLPQLAPSLPWTQITRVSPCPKKNAGMRQNTRSVTERTTYSFLHNSMGRKKWWSSDESRIQALQCRQSVGGLPQSPQSSSCTNDFQKVSVSDLCSLSSLHSHLTYVVPDPAIRPDVASCLSQLQSAACTCDYQHESLLLETCCLDDRASRCALRLRS